MLIQEAQWLHHRMAEIDPQHLYPLCNIGSSTEAFRTREQPFIDAYLFKPARKKARLVKHVDIKAAPGVDLVCDLMNPQAVERLRQMAFRAVLCSNFLEHVPQREAICRGLLDLLPPGGYLLLTCPYRYPYHPDPIDTLFRPTPAELIRLFPGTTVCAQEVLPCGTYWDKLQRSPWRLTQRLLALCLPFYKPHWWRARWGYLPYLFQPFEITCVILKKGGDDNPPPNPHKTRRSLAEPTETLPPSSPAGI